MLISNSQMQAAKMRNNDSIKYSTEITLYIDKIVSYTQICFEYVQQNNIKIISDKSWDSTELQIITESVHLL